MESMIAGIKHRVSKNKRRFQEEGYDLDLVYVKDKIIAMGYPSENVESIYRNSLDEVKRFLEDRHFEKYKIYNLCSERCYDISKFHGRVAVYPFDDHNPPEFSQILPFCKDVHSWLEKDAENVAVVHCKAGKGRTGLMICTYLLFAGKHQTAEEVLQFYGSQRTFDSNGVTIPSQRRYVDYFSFKITKELQYSPTKLMLYSIILEPPPHVGFGDHQAHVQFQVVQHFVEPFISDVYSSNWEENKVVLKLKNPLVLSGDVKFIFTQKMNVDLLHLGTKPKFISSVPHSKLFHFWVNTFFVGKMVSSELSHEVRSSTIQDHGQTEIPRRKSYTKSVSSFTLRNRFAPLSLPDLKSNTDEEEASKENNDGGGGILGLSVRLSKQQIDKASKDHTDRFPENFSVTLFVSRPIEDSWKDSQTPDPGIWMR